MIKWQEVEENSLEIRYYPCNYLSIIAIYVVYEQARYQYGNKLQEIMGAISRKGNQ